MKFFLCLCLIITSFNIFSFETLGIDSGGKDIIMYKNDKISDRVLIIIGAIHGDERETHVVVNYLKDNLETELSTYFIPSINPTLYSEDINRRGYLSEQLDDYGYVKQGSDLTLYNKSLYYRIFYGNKNTYNNGIDHYVDPNRDFRNQILPSTRLLTQLFTDLKKSHTEVIIISIHGYMSEGRVYPEYQITEGNGYIINKDAWTMAIILGYKSGFIAERMYTPAVPIMDRFRGELIAYTGDIEGITAIDIEIDSEDKNNNPLRTYNGVKALIRYLLNK